MIIAILLLFSIIATITLLLIINKGEKAQLIKSIILDIYTNFKQLFENFVRLYRAVRSLFPDDTEQVDNEYKATQSDKNQELIESINETKNKESSEKDEILNINPDIIDQTNTKSSTTDDGKTPLIQNDNLIQSITESTKSLDDSYNNSAAIEILDSEDIPSYNQTDTNLLEENNNIGSSVEEDDINQ